MDKEDNLERSWVTTFHVCASKYFFFDILIYFVFSDITNHIVYIFWGKKDAIH